MALELDTRRELRRRAATVGVGPWPPTSPVPTPMEASVTSPTPHPTV